MLLTILQLNTSTGGAVQVRTATRITQLRPQMASGRRYGQFGANTLYSVATSTGTGTAVANSKIILVRTAASSGSAIVVSFSSILSQGVASTTGIAASLVVSFPRKAVVASSTGTSSGLSTAASFNKTSGSASGISSVQSVSASTIAGTGVSNGSAIADADTDLNQATALSFGTSTVSANSKIVWATVATSVSVSSIVGSAAQKDGVVGSSSGTTTTSVFVENISGVGSDAVSLGLTGTIGLSGKIAAASGSASGTSFSACVAQSTAQTFGNISATSAAGAVWITTVASDGESVGSSILAGISGATVFVQGLSFGYGIAHGDGLASRVFRDDHKTNISSRIAAQFPEFIRNEGPRFVEFLSTYYEHAESINEAVYAARELTSNQDIDSATAVLLEYFRREFLSNVPTSMLADPRDVTKHIRQFYRARGSADAYRYLFRILFNAEIDFYYPGEDILRTSDGRWTLETIVAVSAPLTGNPSTWAGHIVSGEGSDARGLVESVTLNNNSGVNIWELILSNVSGDFSGNEIIRNVDTNETATINTTAGPLGRVLLKNPGAYHQNGDALTFTEATNAGAGATGEVTQTTDLSGITFQISRGGKGYRTSSRITIGTALGTGASFAITSLANTESISINSDIINSVRGVVIQTGPTFASLGSNSTSLSVSLAAANVASTLTSALTFANQTVGRISTITLIDPGQGYGHEDELPEIEVVDDEVSSLNLPDGYGGFKGRDALILAKNAPGAIVHTTIKKRGISYHKNENLNILNTTKGIGTVDEVSTDSQQTGLPVTLRRQSSYSSTGESIPEGTTISKGRYTDTRGFLSWNNKLQDNEYYQAYSYVIVSPVLYSLFSVPVKSLVHPAGTKMFSQYTVQNDLSIAIDLEKIITIRYPMDADYATAANFSSPTLVAMSTSIEHTLSDIDENSNISKDSNTAIWNTTSGTIHIDNTTIINPYAATLISVYTTTLIETFVENSSLIGTGTTFTSLSPVPGKSIIIVPTSGTVGPGLYTVLSVANNTSMTVSPRFSEGTLTSGYILA